MYYTFEDVVKDVFLVFSNAMVYNPVGSFCYKSAVTLKNLFEKWLHEYRDLRRQSQEQIPKGKRGMDNEDGEIKFESTEQLAISKKKHDALLNDVILGYVLQRYPTVLTALASHLYVDNGLQFMTVIRLSLSLSPTFFSLSSLARLDHLI